MDIFAATPGSTYLNRTSGSLSAPRNHLVSASWTTKAFFGGGQAYSADSAVVDVFDYDANSWAVAEPLIRARHRHTATSAAQLIFFAGGVTVDTLEVQSAVDVYNGSTGEKVSVMQLSEARSSLASAGSGGLAFFAGGISDWRPQITSAVVDVFDVATLRWLAPLQLSQARADVVGCACGDLVLFAGGWSGNSPSALIGTIPFTLNSSY